MILGTVFAKADRAYYSSSLIVVAIGLILTQLVFAFRCLVVLFLCARKKGLFLGYTGAGVPLTQFIARNKHASF